ncbi:hypothetical protein OG530_01705 [Streptomyces decoyicus]|uniref:hypothetical protein n=1 Tax=Streptomyces decoyicus TaxID=249567 RepID=UPI002E18ABF1
MHEESGRLHRVVDVPFVELVELVQRMTRKAVCADEHAARPEHTKDLRRQAVLERGSRHVVQQRRQV